MPAFISALVHFGARRRTTRLMLELDDHLLQDIGLTRAEIIQAGRGTTYR